MWRGIVKDGFMGSKVELERWVGKINYGEGRSREGIPGGKKGRAKTQREVDLLDTGK